MALPGPLKGHSTSPQRQIHGLAAGHGPHTHRARQARLVGGELGLHERMAPFAVVRLANIHDEGVPNPVIPRPAPHGRHVVMAAHHEPGTESMDRVRPLPVARDRP